MVRPIKKTSFGGYRQLFFESWDPDQPYMYVHHYAYLRTGAVYLCGHLHTLAGIIPKMHAVHVDGHLELELGDWLDTRK